MVGDSPEPDMGEYRTSELGGSEAFQLLLQGSDFSIEKDDKYVNAVIENERRLIHNAVMARQQWDESRQEAIDNWFMNETEKGPNVFYPRWPNWCSGYDETPFNFYTKEELEQCPHIQHFVKHGHELKLSKSIEDWLGSEFYRYNLMAIHPNGSFWMIGSFKRSKMLEDWYPKYRDDKTNLDGDHTCPNCGFRF